MQRPNDAQFEATNILPLQAGEAGREPHLLESLACCMEAPWITRKAPAGRRI